MGWISKGQCCSSAALLLLFHYWYCCSEVLSWKFGDAVVWHATNITTKRKLALAIVFRRFIFKKKRVDRYKNKNENSLHRCVTWLHQPTNQKRCEMMRATSRQAKQRNKTHIHDIPKNVRDLHIAMLHVHKASDGVVGRLLFEMWFYFCGCDNWRYCHCLFLGQWIIVKLGI